MFALRIQVEDEMALNALRQIQARGHHITPLLMQIGESETTLTKQRFMTSTAPDGSRWAANSQTTYLKLLGGKHVGKSGKINARGANRVQSKRPLILSDQLMNQIHWQLAGSSAVDIGTNLIYGRTQQYGAGQGAFGRDSRNHPIPWGRIPARPFLGESAQGNQAIIRLAMAYLGGGI